jgi:hypothetical protein
VVNDILSGTDIGTWQAEYLLRKVEFERIKHGTLLIFTWANGIALTTVGFGLNLIAKGYSAIDNVSKGEWVALVIGAVASILLYLIGLCLPNEQKKVMKKIQKHFEDAPTKKQAFRERDR